MNREQRRIMAKTIAKNANSNSNKSIDLSKLRTKTNSEVFTPPKLADEMLDSLPKESFGNRNLKFLDPCFGATAVFPIMLLFKLADGLREVIPNPSERIRHIVENMLYLVEKDSDACNFGTAGIQHYANLLKKHLCMYDSPVSVNYIRNGYIENYEVMIETFYESMQKKSA